MATRTDIPSGFTDDDKAQTFQFLDAWLNSTILFSLLYGLYTGILAVTLWNIFINKCRPIRRAMVLLVILLHALLTISFATTWSFTRSAFIENEKGFWALYQKLSNGTGLALSLELGIPASVSTILAGLYMIWCCWTVWGRRWLVVLLPILSLISATVLKALEVHHEYINAPNSDFFQMLCLSFVLATTLSCTLLIIYRILTLAGATRHGVEGRLRVFRRFVEVLVESSALYSITLVLDLAFLIRNSWGGYYSDVIAGIAKGIAPTLFVGRVAAGHTRPNDDCDESTISTLRFQPPLELGTTSLQESTAQSSVPEIDLEAQQQQSDELVAVVERM